MIQYQSLGADKRLNEIVFAGSHDAGITAGGANVRTQSLDLRGQAEAGVRLFDLRIVAAATGVDHGLGKEVQLRAFHADGKLMKNETKTRYVPEVGRQETVTRTKLRGGAFGLGLAGMLQDARDFVTRHPGEFLLLKFDKCTNWPLIADTCVRELGPTIYRGTGSLNTQRQRELAGHVVVLFTADGVAAVRGTHPVGGGILGIRNLYGQDGAAYDPHFHGLQYFGKGGTSVAKPFGKLRQNAKKQGKLMSLGGDGDPDVMGMMYWTTTGLLESIEARNTGMWSDRHRSSLKNLWANGLRESIETRIARHIDPTSHASGGVLKAFMPNIVMIDFADSAKCRTIYELNAVAAVALTRAAREVDQEVEAVRAAYAELQRNLIRRAQHA